MFDALPNVYSAIHNVLEVTQKRFGAVSALAVFPRIHDLAKACELHIRYA